MLFYGIFFILFGILILIKPELLSYLIAIFFIVIWINILTLYFIFNPKKDKDITIWAYKIVKK